MDRASDLDLSTTITLRSGVQIPLFGLGTWLSGNNGECAVAVRAALDAGYRLIDSAQMYGNEADVGKAVISYNADNNADNNAGSSAGSSAADRPAARPFVVTKLKGDAHEAGGVRRALQRSLQLLQMDAVDLFLIHGPGGGRCVDTWREMLACRDEGLARAVGVSNFGIAHIQGLEAAGLELPEVNQIELHVWKQQRPAVEFLREKGIAVMGYCPLARCKRFGETRLKEIAEARGVHEASLCIRWSLEAGVVTIPKSSSPERIASNARVLQMAPFTPEEKAILAEIDEGFCASNAVKSMDLPWEEVA
jgi:diketogulonate reductase-like aldo/keto reductase